jgi:hypothetical protein
VQAWELQRQVKLHRSTYPVTSPTVTFERLPVAAWKRSAAGPCPLMSASSISACDDDVPTGTTSDAPLARSVLLRPLQLSPLLLLLLLLLLLVTDRCSCRNVPARARPCEIRQRGRAIPLISAVRSRFVPLFANLIDAHIWHRVESPWTGASSFVKIVHWAGPHDTEGATRVDQNAKSSLCLPRFNRTTSAQSIPSLLLQGGCKELPIRLRARGTEEVSVS